MTRFIGLRSFGSTKSQVRSSLSLLFGEIVGGEPPVLQGFENAIGLERFVGKSRIGINIFDEAQRSPHRGPDVG